VFVLFERCGEFCLIDSETTGFGNQVLLAQRILVLENVLCELPEAPLRSRRHCRLVGERCLRMKRKREAPKLNAYLRRIRPHHLIQNRQCRDGDGALEIGEELNSDRRVGGAATQSFVWYF